MHVSRRDDSDYHKQVISLYYVENELRGSFCSVLKYSNKKYFVPCLGYCVPMYGNWVSLVEQLQSCNHRWSARPRTWAKRRKTAKM